MVLVLSWFVLLFVLLVFLCIILIFFALFCWFVSISLGFCLVVLVCVFCVCLVSWFVLDFMVCLFVFGLSWFVTFFCFVFCLIRFGLFLVELAFLFYYGSGLVLWICFGFYSLGLMV